MNIQTILKKHFNIEAATIKQLIGFCDLNYYIKTATNQQFILKIATPEEDKEYLAMQNLAMLHLQKKNIDLSLPTVIANQTNEYITELYDAQKRKRFVRLLTWVEGRLLEKVNPKTPVLLESFGAACAKLCLGLQGFEHSAAHQFFKWNNNQVAWIKQDFDFIMTKEERAIADYFYPILINETLPKLNSLSKQIIHNDTNSYNVIVSNDLKKPTVTGIIDFGDLTYSNTINELAIACAYSILDKNDPINAACSIIKGFHSILPLQEKELEILYHSIVARLLISVTVSSKNIVENPNNEYLFVSHKPAWNLLRKLRNTSPAFAHYAFRNACGFLPHPKAEIFKIWATENQANFAPLMGFDLKTTNKKILDCSVGSWELGNNENFENIDKFDKVIFGLMKEEGVTVGIGRYNEIRPFYTTDNYLVEGNNGPEWRTVHLGLDVFMKARTPVFAPLNGKIHSFQNNAIERDYGSTIILEHQINEKLIFYTLYGHLSVTSLLGLKKGKSVKKGEKIAEIGERPENGNWPPHLHFQINLDMLGEEGNFPGVAFPRQQKIWESLCPDPNLLIGMTEKALIFSLPSIENLTAIRQQHFSKNLSISYQKNPLHIVRGYRQYLYTADGRRYLDTRNNVPHVGHQHPKVVKAAQRQIAVLNTNTRYLYESLNEYGKALCATLPNTLNVVFFVNSGSEANELALRIAKTVSNQEDFLAIEMGYHGNTSGCIEVSSYKFDGKGGKGAPEHTHVLPMPDTYRGRYKGENAGLLFANHAENLLQKIEEKGRNIAGFIGEAILSCGGQIILPKGYLKRVYELVRAKGGLCIADEVQVGFGRVGSHFWGFELHNVVPDIVTMGKPMGNGHPLGAVVTTRKIADAFANGMEYFNTYGGNPVSTTIGLEVLKIMEEEKLQENAREVGNYIIEQFYALKAKYAIIGHVRGIGFFSGFELVKNQQTLEPATEQAAYLANRMRELGILISTDGKYENVIKIKPPMIFSKTDADFMIGKLEMVLKEDFMKVE